MLLIMAIIGGIVFGLGFLLLSAETQKKVVDWGDSQLLNYHIPILLFLLGSKFVLSAESAKVTWVMALAMFLAFWIGLFIANRVLKLDHDMRNGFLVLASCTNTGHGVMLLAASTSTAGILGLAMGPMYVGFVAVIFLPMFLINRAGVRRFVTNMVLWHPASYFMVAGLLCGQIKWLGAIWLGVVGIRLLFAIPASKKIQAENKGKPEEEQKPLPMNTSMNPFIAAVLTMGAFLSFSHAAAFEVVTAWYPIAMVFLAAITIGIKMGSKMEGAHWRIVIWINIFGIVIAPAVGLLLAKATGCSYEEAYVLTYSLSQPPAYLGMVWLRQGKFGEEFAISEWAFTIQALLAYIWAIFAPGLLKIFF